MTEVLGVGIIGCGNIARTYARLLPLFRGIRLTACADRDQDAAATFAGESGLRAMPVAELLSAPDIDIVLNLTIPAAHLDVSRAALGAGKHVYSEKPLALSVPEARALLSEAAARGLRVGAAPDTFLGGAPQMARAAIDAGRVGPVHSGVCFLQSAGMEAWHPNPGFFFQPGGGPMLDMGPYYIANLVQLLGPVASVQAMGARPRATRQATAPGRTGPAEIPVEVDTTLHALLRFVGGAQIMFAASWDVWRHGLPQMELYGTEGSLSLPDPNFFGGAVDLSKGAEVQPDPGGTHPLGQPNEGDRANYRGIGLADMAAAIRSGRPHRANGELALHVVDVLTGILRAAETGHAVPMTSCPDRPAALPAEEAAALMVHSDVPKT